MSPTTQILRCTQAVSTQSLRTLHAAPMCWQNVPVCQLEGGLVTSFGRVIGPRRDICHSAFLRHLGGAGKRLWGAGLPVLLADRERLNFGVVVFKIVDTILTRTSLLQTDAAP